MDGEGKVQTSGRLSTPCRETCLPEAFSPRKTKTTLGAAIWLAAGRCHIGNTLELIWFVLPVFGDAAIMRDRGRAIKPGRLLYFSRSPPTCWLPGLPLRRPLAGLVPSFPVVKLSFYCRWPLEKQHLWMKEKSPQWRWSGKWFDFFCFSGYLNGWNQHESLFWTFMTC